MVTVCNERSAPPVTPEALEVLAFNMERGIYPEALGDFLAHFRPDVILASELDVGCARSGGLDVPRELARRLGMHYAFVPEFRELTDPGPGPGIHGNAIFSRFPILRAEAVALPMEYDWYFDRQKRTGGRTALLAKLDLGDRALGVASLHLENRTGPDGRLRQMGAVLEAVEALLPGLPVILGGDLNTNGFDGGDKERLRAILADPALRKHCLEVKEPCLELAEQRGYRLLPGPDSPIPTRRKHMPGHPPLELRLDWLLLRDCRADGARILSARREDCPFLKSPLPAEELSDHDAVAAKIYL